MLAHHGLSSFLVYPVAPWPYGQAKAIDCNPTPKRHTYIMHALRLSIMMHRCFYCVVLWLLTR